MARIQNNYLLEYLIMIINENKNQKFQWTHTNINENVSILEIRFSSGCYMHITNKEAIREGLKIIKNSEEIND